MFSKRHFEKKKIIIKILDNKKDPTSKLKKIRSVLESNDPLAIEKFFNENYSQIFYVFWDNVSAYDNEYRDKKNKFAMDDLEYLIFMLMQIIERLPHLIHERWQFHVLGRYLSRLLHINNSLAIKKFGFEIFMTWYGILNDNSSTECKIMFRKLIPTIGSQGYITSDMFTRFPQGSNCSPDIEPFSDVNLNLKLEFKVEDTKYLFIVLLNSIVFNTFKIKLNQFQRVKTFSFVFNQFKLHYLSIIFEVSMGYNSEEIENLSLSKPGNDPVDSHVEICRILFLEWISQFLFMKKPFKKNSSSKSSHSSNFNCPKYPKWMKKLISIETNIDERYTVGDCIYYRSILSRTNWSNFSSDEYSVVQSYIVGNAENVLLVLQILKYGFSIPIKYSNVTECIIEVFAHWIQVIYKFLMDMLKVINRWLFDQY
ncbi:hypothetical protein A3Q56_00027 [Intoshia linei]|uniref:Uncharacterized protein n=1 Tax=Intoshia linei TaxID=1819745 RepID=A0A177BF58_9BILA|nr:hypothetical protein A3Q56_00027 [Intoshia linei]